MISIKDNIYSSSPELKNMKNLYDVRNEESVACLGGLGDSILKRCIRILEFDYFSRI